MNDDENLAAAIMSDNPDVDAAIIEATGIALAMKAGRTAETNEDFLRAAKALPVFTDLLRVMAESKDPLVFRSCRSKEGPTL